MTEQELNVAVKKVEDFTLKYEGIWEKMSNVRKAEEKKSFMVSTEEFQNDFHDILAVKEEFKDSTPVILALGLASDAIFKYSGQACLAVGRKDGLAQIGIVKDDVAELGKLHIAAEEAKEQLSDKAAASSEE